MKRLFLILALALIGTLAFAGNTLLISGTVAANTTINVAALPAATTLDFTTTPGAPIAIANVTEISNDFLGYKVTLASANGAATTAQVKGTAHGTILAYSLLYNAVAVVFSASSATLTNVAAPTGGAGVTKPLTITYTGTFLPADTYTDTLTFTITGN